MMERLAIQKLINWKMNPYRKPLIISGVRQVGKTWLIREFGKPYYSETVCINFESSRFLQNLFSENFDIKRILTALQIELGIAINSKT